MEQVVKMYVMIALGIGCMFVLLTMSMSFSNTGHAFASDTLVKCEAKTTAEGNLCVFSGTEETCNVKFPNGYDLCEGTRVVNGNIITLTPME